MPTPEIIFTKQFSKTYAKLPQEIKTILKKQLGLFLENPRHPSLHVKKMKGLRPEVWEGRISKKYRFVFEKIDKRYYFLRIGPHDIL